MAVLLLIERSRIGRGPMVPIREQFSKIKVDGLRGSGELRVHYEDGSFYTSVENGTMALPNPVLKGSTICAEVLGEGNCVTAQLEH